MARPSFGGEHSCAGGPRAAVSPRVAVSPLCAGSPRAPVGPRPAKNRIVNGFSVVSRISLHDAAISLSPSPSPTGSVLVRHRRPGWPMFRAGEVGSVAASHTATVKDLSVLGRKVFHGGVNRGVGRDVAAAGHPGLQPTSDPRHPLSASTCPTCDATSQGRPTMSRQP